MAESPHYKELLQVLNEFEVEYLIALALPWSSPPPRVLVEDSFNQLFIGAEVRLAQVGDCARQIRQAMSCGHA